MVIKKELLDSLTEQAKVNPRLRQAFDLRTSPDDNSQRILNAVEPGTILPIHRHRTTTETVVCLRGRCVQYLYNDKGEQVEAIYLQPNTDVVGMSVEVGQWHFDKLSVDAGSSLSKAVPSFLSARMESMSR